MMLGNEIGMVLLITLWLVFPWELGGKKKKQKRMGLNMQSATEKSALLCGAIYGLVELKLYQVKCVCKCVTILLSLQDFATMKNRGKYLHIYIQFSNGNIYIYVRVYLSIISLSYCMCN